MNDAKKFLQSCVVGSWRGGLQSELKRFFNASCGEKTWWSKEIGEELYLVWTSSLEIGKKWTEQSPLKLNPGSISFRAWKDDTAPFL